MSSWISRFLFPKAEIKPCPWTTSAFWDQYSQTANGWGGICDQQWFWFIILHAVFKSQQRFNPQEKQFLQPSLRETAARCHCTLLEPHFTENIMRASHSLCQYLVSMQGAGLFIQRPDTAALKYKSLFSSPKEAMKAEKANLNVEDR